MMDSIRERIAKKLFFQIQLQLEEKGHYSYRLITPKDWIEFKDIFFRQRMERNPDYTQKEKIKLEIELVQNIIFKEDDNKVLKGRYLEMLNEKAGAENKPNEKYKTQNLFNVGLLFAIGKMSKYFTINGQNKTVMNQGYSASKIAEELGNESYEKYILASINNYATDNPNSKKNIFNSLNMMTKIIDHCNAEKLPIDPYFISRLPIE